MVCDMAGDGIKPDEHHAPRWVITHVAWSSRGSESISWSIGFQLCAGCGNHGVGECTGDNSVICQTILFVGSNCFIPRDMVKHPGNPTVPKLGQTAASPHGVHRLTGDDAHPMAWPLR